MKTYELFEDEQPTLFSYCKGLNAEFKELAKKYQLTLVAGMGWPQITKDGAWFGGGLGAYRKKEDDDSLLSVDVKRKAFLKALARQLEDLIEKGHTVRVAAGAERSKHNELVPAGKVFEMLQQAAITTSPPGNVRYDTKIPTLAWYVSAPAALLSSELLSVVLGAYSKDYSKKARAIFYIRGDAAKISALAKKASAIQKQRVYDDAKKDYVSSADYVKLHNSLLMWAVEHGHDLKERGYGGRLADVSDLEHNVPAKDVPSLPSISMTIKKNRIIPKGSIIVNLDDVTPLKAYVS